MMTVVVLANGLIGQPIVYVRKHAERGLRNAQEHVQSLEVVQDWPLRVQPVK